MKAMILAAGLGTRLRPLTEVRPKVLVPLNGLPILDFWIWRLHASGYEAVVVNASHLSEQLHRAVQESSWPIPVEVRVEKQLLGTGGGIRNVLDFFGEEPLTVINGDVISDADLKKLRETHESGESSVTFLMHDCPPFNNVAVSLHGAVMGFGQKAKERSSLGADVTLEAFSGIHVVNPSCFRRAPSGQPFDILNLYDELILKGDPPRACYQKGLWWREMGTIETYGALCRELSSKHMEFLKPIETGARIVVHPQSRLARDAVLKGCVTVGRGCSVGRRVTMKDTILWNDVQVDDDCHLQGCIVADGARVTGNHVREVIVRTSP